MQAWRRGLAATLILAYLPCVFADSDPDDPNSTIVNPAAVRARSAQPRDSTLYLAVNLNGEPTNTIVSFVQRATHLWVQVRDLQNLGIDLARALPAGQPTGDDDLIDLNSVTGLHYRYDPTHQSVDLSVTDAVRSPYAVGRHPPTKAGSASATGLVLNYDALVQGDTAQAGSSSLTLANEQRLFSPVGVLDNTGIVTMAAGNDRYLRQATTYQYDDPRNLTSIDVGDANSSSLAWTRSVRLGGLQYRRDFTLAPDLVTFPLPQLVGSAALPSTVDLYVNNVRQISSSVPSGPFVINGAATITGGGMATVVVRDELGRAVSATLPIYVDSRLLAQGLSSFSIESGFLRSNYGASSFGYQGNMALSGTWRYGVSDLLTLESHGEATSDLVDGGLGALLRLGNAGVVRAALIGSSGPGRDGGQATIGYQLVLPKISVTAQSSRAYADFHDLAAIGGTPPARIEDQLSVSVPLPRERSIGASYVRVDDSIAGRSTIGAAWYSTRISRRLSSYLNVSRDFQQSRTLSVWLGFSIDLGTRLSAFSSAGVQNGRANYSSGVFQSADYGGGWEWQAQANRSDSGSSVMARGGYLGKYGLVTAAVQEAAGHPNVSVEAVGGMVCMDGVFEAARAIGAGFALVSTDGVAGVPVLHENRQIGVTDETGHLLVPDLNPYQRNTLAIDSMSLPADASVPTGAIEIVPRGASGVLARFPVGRYAAATITLVDPLGKMLPVGSIAHHLESGRDFTIGYDGQAFIEDLVGQNHLLVTGPGLQCVAQFDFDTAHDNKGTLRQLGNVTCREQGVHTL
jgi:outer membrane usher protein